MGCGTPTKRAETQETEKLAAPADVRDLVIDVHAHVFNAWDLPLAGFIRKTRPALGPVASVMTRLVRERSVRDRAGQVVPDAESGTCLMDLPRIRSFKQTMARSAAAA
jgi:hypothetical protein